MFVYSGGVHPDLCEPDQLAVTLRAAENDDSALLEPDNEIEKAGDKEEYRDTLLEDAEELEGEYAEEEEEEDDDEYEEEDAYAASEDEMNHDEL